VEPLIQRQARNHNPHKRKRLDIGGSLQRKQKASVKRSRHEYDEDADIRLYVR